MSDGQKIVFSVASREIKGKSVTQLRRQNQLPANVFGLNKESESIQVDRTLFDKLYSEQGDTGLIYLQIGDKKRQTPVLIDEVQTHPVTGKTVHAAFKRVDLTEKVSAEVPVELVGEFDVDDANLLTIISEIEVEALPEDLPDRFEIDISTLTEVGQSVTIADLKYDTEKVTIVLGEDEDPSEMPVVLVQGQQEEVEEEPEPVEVEGEAGSQETPGATEESQSSESDE